jgi:hypothetical protein
MALSMVRLFASGWSANLTGSVAAQLAAGAALILGGCVGEKVVTKSSPQLDQYHIKAVVVMPFETLATPQVIRPDIPELPVPGGVVRSDITVATPRSTERLDQRTATVPSEAGMRVARIFSGKLRSSPGIVVRSPAEAEVELKQLRVVGKELTREEAGRRVALRLKTDAALVGLLRVYRERGGSRYGDDPAAVGFEVKLVAADGRVLWIGEYSEVQRPLTEDFKGFLDRGFGFLTAEELTSYGAEQLIRKSPFKR